MSKYLLGVVLLVGNLWGLDVPIDVIEKHIFKDIIEVNSQIVQRSNAKESVMARLGGKVKKYFVQEGQKVKIGQKIAIIESLKLSSLSSKLKLLRQQSLIHNKNYKMLKNLYNLGLETAQNVNKEQQERDETTSQIESVKQQLSLMGVSVKGGLKSTYTLYAGSTGTISKVLAPINSVVNSDTPLLSIIKGSKAILVKSFIPLRYTSSVKVNQKGEISYGSKNYKMHISQILPELDEQTQQMVVLSTLDEKVNNLFVNAFVGSKLYVGEAKKYLAVKKTALSFFNNEWVVFVPKHHEEEHDADKSHNEHEGHDHEKHEFHEEEHDEHKENSREGHDEHEEEEVPFTFKVVKILKQDQSHIAIEGLEEHEEYVSDKAYHIKSLLLKSSLGGHGH